MSDFDVFLADCPARTTLALVGDTWSVVVIMASATGRTARASCSAASAGSRRRC
jgi:DNA-binding HxlR family transcriptional regulator